MVIGKSYKESNVVLSLALVLMCIIDSSFVVAGILIDLLWLRIVCFILALIFIFVTLIIPYIIYKQKNTLEDIILYDEFNDTIILKNHNRVYKLLCKDIKRITYHNLSISSTSYFLLVRQDYGKLKFYLSDGRTIKSEAIHRICESYDELNNIVFGEDYREPEEEALLFRIDGKISSWGKKNEYPAILSVLVSIILPLIGLVFVLNQAKYKEFKYGKNSGVMILSITISLLWWLTVYVLINVIL